MQLTMRVNLSKAEYISMYTYLSYRASLGNFYNKVHEKQSL